MLGRVFGTKRGGEAEGGENYLSKNFTVPVPRRVLLGQSKRVAWVVGYVQHALELRIACRNLVRRPEGK